MTLIHQLITLSNIKFHLTGPLHYANPEILEIPLIKPVFLPSNHHHKCYGTIDTLQMRKGTHHQINFSMFQQISISIFRRSGAISVFSIFLHRNSSSFFDLHVSGFPLKRAFHRHIVCP